jgi:hypothetical protein
MCSAVLPPTSAEFAAIAPRDGGNAPHSRCFDFQWNEFATLMLL